MRFGRLQVLAVAIGVGLTLVATASAAQGRKSDTIPTAPRFAPTDLVAPAGANWATNGGDYGQTRYSTLNQITSANVSSLKLVWETHLNGSGTGTKYKGEATPLVYNGIMYMVTGNSDVFALNATTGKVLWQYNSTIPQFMNTVCCGWDARGLALGGGLVYVAQLDGTLTALDQQTGGVIWSVKNARWQDGYTMTMAPLYYNNMVIVGVSGSEYGARGSMTAYDATNGNQLWRFYTTPTPGDIGSGTWPNNTEWMHGGATIWNQPTVDPSTGLIYFSTANADPWSSRGPGDDLFTSSYIALRAQTGQYAWHFQVVHHDIWDYDCPSNTVLFNTTIGGVSTPVMAEPCKTGWVYELDRRNGNPATQIDEKPVPQNAFQNTAATQPTPAGDPFALQCPRKDQWADTASDGKPYLFGCIWTPYDDQQFTAVATGAGGGNNWIPASYNPNTNLLYTCSGNGQNAYKAIPNASSLYVGGRTFIGLQFGGTKPGVINYGQLTATNMSTNKTVWQNTYTPAATTATNTQTDGACSGGTLTTASNLVFAAVPEQVEHAIAAYDAATGAQLWKFNTDAGIESPPMTFSVNGQQYIAVYAGGRNTTVAPFTHGDGVYVFSLSGT
jgi:PQQ-dependent dehydrogenase (methanol/ethanol family)